MSSNGDDFSGLRTLEDYTVALRYFTNLAQECCNNNMANHVENENAITKTPNDLGTFCQTFIQKWGYAALAQAIKTTISSGETSSHHLSANQLATLVDALRGPSNVSFPVDSLAPLLIELDIDWNSMSGEELGELFASLLLFAKAQSSPASVGESLSQVFTNAQYTPTSQTIADAVRFLWEEGFAWGRVPGALLSHLLNDRWKLTHIPMLICALVQGFLETEQLDLLDFDSLDRIEKDGHNPAIRIGGFIDALGLPEGCELALCANIVRAFVGTFSEANAPNGSESGPNIHPPRADLFIGRVLQQLNCFAEESSEPDTADSVRYWRLSAAIGLACSLCAGPIDMTVYDWRLDRQQHAYCVGEILQQLRPSWPSEDVSMLIEALRIPSLGRGTTVTATRGGGPGVPTRIIAEVIEGLNVDWDVSPSLGMGLGGKNFGFFARGMEVDEEEDSGRKNNNSNNNNNNMSA